MAATADEDRRAEQLDKLLEATGTLGTYHDDAGNFVVAVPSSGASTFVAADAAALGFSVSVRAEDIELSDIATIQSLIANVKWTPRRGR